MCPYVDTGIVLHDDIKQFLEAVCGEQGMAEPSETDSPCSGSADYPGMPSAVPQDAVLVFCTFRDHHENLNFRLCMHTCHLMHARPEKAKYPIGNQPLEKIRLKAAQLVPPTPTGVRSRGATASKAACGPDIRVLSSIRGPF